MNLGAGELIAIAVVILLLFGGSKLKEIMRTIGEGIREFRHATSAATEELEAGIGLEPEDGKGILDADGAELTEEQKEQGPPG